MKSIVQKEKRCFLCGKQWDLQDHHIYEGNANRKLSEKYGMKVWVCSTCHHKLHFQSYSFAIYIKQCGQRVFEQKVGTRQEFMNIFGKNFLD